MSPIKAVIFDKDGTLHDTEKVYEQAWKAAALELNVPDMETTILDCTGTTEAWIAEYWAKKYPTIPYIMITRPNYYTNMNGEDTLQRRDVVMRSYLKARDLGDKNVYFIDGESIFRGPFEGDCTIDGTHPNDLGFSRMAEVVTAVLRRCLRDGKIGI